MSCLIQSLLPRKVAERLDHDILSNADDHGGWEMGTWTFSTYLDVFDKLALQGATPEIPPAEGDGRRIGTPLRSMGDDYLRDPVHAAGVGYWESRVYSLPECARIAAHLRAMKAKGRGKRRHYLYASQFEPSPTNPFNIRIRPKYQPKLIALFECGDEVVWYSI